MKRWLSWNNLSKTPGTKHVPISIYGLHWALLRDAMHESFRPPPASLDLVRVMIKQKVVPHPLCTSLSASDAGHTVLSRPSLSLNVFPLPPVTPRIDILDDLTMVVE